MSASAKAIALVTMALTLASCRQVAPMPITPDWIAPGEAPASHFGYSVGTASDVDGDGYADVVVGADRYNG
jgi:hypothetical protein